MIKNDDSAWQIALGRFIQPVLVLLRGGIINPWLISVLAMLWLSLSGIILIDYFKINSIPSAITILGIMVCNSSVIASNATYLPWVDFYSLALFLAIFGVWLIDKKKIICIISGILCFAVSMGIYQAYISVSVAIIMISIFICILNNIKFKECIIKAVKSIAALLIGALIYYAIWKVFQKVFNIWTADSYNGLASVGDYSDFSLLDSIKVTYQKFLYYFAYPETFATMMFRGKSLSVFWTFIIRLVNIAISVLFVIKVIKTNVKRNISKLYWIIELVIFILIPLGFNCICIISKGMIHPLMTYSFCMFYVFALVVCSEKCEKNEIKETDIEHIEEKAVFRKNKSSYICYGAIILCAVIIYSNIVYANQAYLKKELQNESAGSMMTRIVYEIEHMDGYEKGVTPVAFVGSFEISDYTKDIEGFEEIVPYSMGKTVLLYPGTEYAYLKYDLNVNMNLIRVDESNEFIKNMPCYPDKGSIDYLDNVVIVKISN